MPKGASAPNYFSTLRAFFGFATLHEWVGVSPLIRVRKPETRPGAKEVFTPDEMTQWLDAAKNDKTMLWLLVLSGFCGLRYTEALRLTRDRLDLEANEIHVSEMKTQKRGLRERWVSILPNARAWIDYVLAMPDPKKHGGRTPPPTLIGKSDATVRVHRVTLFREHELPPWEDNVLRRSFGSYHLAKFENPNLTAAQMGHTDAQTTVGKYRKLQRKGAGEAWFGLTP